MIVFRSSHRVRGKDSTQPIQKVQTATVFAADFTDSDLEALEDGMESLFLSLLLSFIERRFDEVFSVG